MVVVIWWEPEFESNFRILLIVLRNKLPCYKIKKIANQIEVLNLLLFPYFFPLPHVLNFLSSSALLMNDRGSIIIIIILDFFCLAKSLVPPVIHGGCILLCFVMSYSGCYQELLFYDFVYVLVLKMYNFCVATVGGIKKWWNLQRPFG